MKIRFFQEEMNLILHKLNVGEGNDRINIMHDQLPMMMDFLNLLWFRKSIDTKKVLIQFYILINETT